MKCLSAAVVCLLCALPASAQEQSGQQPLKIAASVWIAAVASDHVTTFQFRTRFPALLHEENVLVRGLENHPAWLVTANGAIDAATGWATYRFLGKRHPRLATIAFFGAAAYRSYLSVHNMKMMDAARNFRGS
jgi:hypothetical protein